jgi:hypothetical protein
MNAEAAHSVSEGALDGNLFDQYQGHRYLDVRSPHTKLMRIQYFTENKL